ncbi:hypothetical protein OG590_39155 (plasmid) [Streptomyces goshikiensis]|uniref:hypothetical protein n=1 Tax=Streptomyces goshikiensis TaxID=1942 RepID=UPI002F90A4DC|nr:hypothetical protein OG590_39155 [Streptomyces goshikiensis]
MVSTGGVAVFIATTEAGPAALIVVGSLLLVAAIMGLQIKEIGLADGTLTWPDLSDLGDQIRNADTPDDALNVASAATTVAPDVQRDIEIRELSHVAYEQVITDRLVSIFGSEAVRGSSGPHDRGFDIMVTIGGKRAAIETKFGDPTKPFPNIRLRDVVDAMVRTPQLDAVIVVSNMYEPGLHTQEMARDSARAMGKKFAYVRWGSDRSNQELQRVIEEQLLA